MTTPPAIPSSQISVRNDTRGILLTACWLSLIAFGLILSNLSLYYLFMYAGPASPLKVTKSYYEAFLWILVFLGLMGTTGFILGLTGVGAAVKNREEFKHFPGVAGILFGSAGLLVLIEYAARLIGTLFR